MDTIKIHGKQYVTVDGRVKAAHEACKKISISTEVLPIPDKVVVKATVVTEKGTFTGISAANEAKMIEKQSPYEVAETSAVGRALGFAGYGVINGIATADEIAKTPVQGTPRWLIRASYPSQCRQRKRQITTSANCITPP